MPDRTVYSLTDRGREEFSGALRASVRQFSYDTNIFSIAAFFWTRLPLMNSRNFCKNVLRFCRTTVRESKNK